MIRFVLLRLITELSPLEENLEQHVRVHATNAEPDEPFHPTFGQFEQCHSEGGFGERLVD